MTEKPMIRHAARTIRVLFDAAGRREPGRCIPIGSICTVGQMTDGLLPVIFPAGENRHLAYLKNSLGLAAYYSQDDWPDVPYPAPGFAAATVKSGGGSVCCASMVVETLTGYSFGPEAAAALALRVGARMFGGTDLRLLGRALAGRFGLFYLTTDDQNVLRRHLGAGKAAIVNVGGNREGHLGLLSDGGHYVAVLAVEDGLFTVADPKSSHEKYGPKYPHRRVAVRHAGIFLRISPADLEADCLLRSPRYHLFG